MHRLAHKLHHLTVSLDGAKQLLCPLAAGGLLLFTTVSARADWTNVWSDEFDGSAVDTSKWTYDTGGGGWGNNEKEYYTSRTNNAYVSGGLLHIRAQIEDTNGNHYTSARLKTQGLFWKTHGWIEFRTKLPQGVGFWPANWMLGTNIASVGWPKCGEIDVMENKGTDAITIGGTIHYENGGGDIYQTQSYNLPTPGDSVTNFHTYAIQWYTNSIVWLVDNVAIKTWTNWTSSIGPFPAPFDRPFFLLMNLAVGGNYVGNPSEGSIDPYMPGEMLVDYVRIYDFISSTNPPTIPTGLTATPGGSHIALNWNLSTNATSYNVKRSLDSGGPYTTIAMPTVTSYNDSNVVGGTTYYYVVSGTNLFGESTNSVEASATPVPPPTPTGLTATPSGASVALSWDSSSGATSYRVKRSLVMGGSYSLIGTPTSTSYEDTDVASCTAYYYVVSATNSFGESTNSVEASATLGSYSIAVNSGGSATGQFIADANVSGGTVAAPTGSAIDTTGVTSPAPQAVYQTERYNTFTYTFGSLSTGTAYKVRLHFAEYYFNSANARRFNVAINDTQVLTNYDIFAAAGGQNKAVVDEYMVTPNGSGQIIIAYTVGTADLPKSSGIEVILPAPVAPTGLAATAGDAQVALNWDAVSGATGYNLGRATNSVGPYAAVTNGLTGTSYTDASVVNGTTYYYVVSTVQGGCESTNSTEVSATPTAPSEFPAWQMQYFGCTGCPEAASDADPDGDGQDNMAEFMSGTNPTNSASAFHVISITETGSDVVVEWQAGGGTTNIVQATSGMADGYATNYLDISPLIAIPGSGDVITNYPDIGGATNTPLHFYRIRLGP
jgi:beta-glucanase (GH16 family)